MRFVMKMNSSIGLVMSEWEGGHLAGGWTSGGRTYAHIYLLVIFLIQSVVFPLSLNELFPYFEVALVARRL